MNSTVVVQDLAIVVAAKNHPKTILDSDFRIKRYTFLAEWEGACYE